MDLQLKGKKVLFATVSADGHFNPLTGLAVHLKRQGCDVRWYISSIFSEKLQQLDIPHYPILKATDVNGNNISEIFPQRKDIKDAGERFDFDLINVFGDRGPEYFAEISEIYQSFDFDIMIADSFFSGIPFVKHKLNVPVISVGIVPLATDSADLAPYGMGSMPPEDAARHKEYADLRTMVNSTVFKNSIDKFSASLEKEDIPHKKSVIFDLLIRESDLYLQIGSPGFEYNRSDTPENVRFVGALLPAVSKSSVKPWFDGRLNQYKKVVLVTQGTIERDTEKLIVPALDALKDTDVLVIATTSGNNTAELRQRFPQKNLIIEDYIPFAVVMPFVNLYITNGGYSGTLLAIQNKLPIVAAGLYEGKAEICSRVGYFNYGINLNTETPDALQIKSAVEKVLGNTVYKNNVAKLADEMSSYDAIALSTGYIKELIGKTVVVSDN